MLRMIVVLFSFLLFVPLATAETIERPFVKPGDTWVYQFTTEQNANQRQGQYTEKHYELTVVRAGSTSILISKRERGSKQPPIEKMVGSEWSKYRSINGEEAVVSQPLKFPLKPGKSWKLKFIENHPSNQLKYKETQLNYTVIGWEEISVPAGKFKAIKIEADGNWKSEPEPSANSSINSRTDQDGITVVTQAKKLRSNPSTGRLYSAYWYVPEAKVYVKSVEEQFFSNGTLYRRNTEELESLKVSQ